MSFSQILSEHNPVFRAYAFYSVILVVKMLLMAFRTSRKRLAKKVFTNMEDVRFNNAANVKFDDPEVNQIVRAHRNDLENILVFFVTAFLFVLTNPNPVVALFLFRVFTIARVVHSLLFHIHVVRGIAFVVGNLATIYMALHVTTRFI